MKIFFSIFFFILFGINVISQTFRRSFDVQDNGSSANFGQNKSFYSNVASELHNVESLALQGYIDMYKATRDRKYLDKFIIHAKRVQERRGDNFNSLDE
ncbi:MAG: hypothetical protein AABZ74_11960 [Cyanobacteriota bacterium]